MCSSTGLDGACANTVALSTTPASTKTTTDVRLILSSHSGSRRTLLQQGNVAIMSARGFRSMRRLEAEVERDGQILYRNLRSQLITKDDLVEQLRGQGVDSIERVRKCYLESDAKMSVIQDESDRPSRPPEKRTSSRTEAQRRLCRVGFYE